MRILNSCAFEMLLFSIVSISFVGNTTAPLLLAERGNNFSPFV